MRKHIVVDEGLRAKTKDALAARIVKASNGNIRMDSQIRLADRLIDEAIIESRELFETLPATDRKLAIEILTDLVTTEGGDKNLFKMFWEVDYRDIPVGIEQFVKDPDYMGNITRDLFPTWHRELSEVFGAGSQYYEWLFGGSIGSGKSTCAALAFVYKIYQLSCLHNPHRYYNLIPSSAIVFGIYSVTKTQAIDVGYTKIRSFIEASPYFKDRYPFAEHIITRVNFTKHNVQVLAGCVAEGTKILTATGEVNVEDLPDITDRVITFDGADLINAHYWGIQKSGYKKCLSLIDGFGNELICSEDHKILTEVDGVYEWKRAGALQEGETMFSLQRDEDGDRVYNYKEGGKSSRIDEPLQILRGQDKWGTLSQDEEGEGHRREEVEVGDSWDKDLHNLQRGKAGVYVWDQSNDTENYGASQGIPSGRVQSVWCERDAELVLGEPRTEAGRRSQDEIRSKVERNGGITLLEILCQESGLDPKTANFTGTERALEVINSKMEREQLSPLQDYKERRGPSLSGEVSREGESSRQESKSEETSNGETATDNADQGSHLERPVVLQGELRVLRDVVRERVSFGAYHPGLQRRAIFTLEHRSIVQGMQLVKGSERFIGVRQRFEDSTKENKETPRVCRTVLSRKQSVGERLCFDIVNVGSTGNIVSNNIVTSNSRSFHTLGMDVFSMFLDEVNFMTKAKGAKADEGQAFELYSGLRARLKSRFIRKGGTVPGMMFLVSSKKATSSFLEIHKERVKDEIDNKMVRVSEYSQWAVKDKRLFVKPKFNIQVGDRIHPSRILEGDEDPDIGCTLVTVPGEFRNDFERDIDGAIRDLAGVATFGVSPLLRDKRVLDKAISTELEHPFTQEIIHIDITDPTEVLEYFVVERMFDVYHSAYRLRRHPDRNRAMHIDIGLTKDRLGIAMAHSTGFKKVKRRRPDGSEYEDRCPEIEVDFVLGVVPTRGSEVDLAKIRTFILNLSDMGIKIFRITLDNFEGADFRQILQSLGYEAEKLSVDKTDVQYRALRQSFQEGRIKMANHAMCIKELSFLEHNVEDGKVDHPHLFDDGTVGTKDCVDALCGCVSTILTDRRAMITTEELDNLSVRPTKGLAVRNGTLNWDELDKEN